MSGPGFGIFGERTAAGTPIGPLTGDAAGLDAFVITMRKMANSIESAESMLRRLASEGTQVGKTAEHIAVKIEDTCTDLAKVAALYDAVRPHLRSYANALERLQPRFATRLEELETAQAADAAVNAVPAFLDPEYDVLNPDDNPAQQKRDDAAAALLAAEQRYDRVWDRWQSVWSASAAGIAEDAAGLVRESYDNSCDPNSRATLPPGTDVDDPSLYEEIFTEAAGDSDALAGSTWWIPGVGSATGGADFLVKLGAIGTEDVTKKDLAIAALGIIPFAKGTKHLDDLLDGGKYVGKHASDAVGKLVDIGRRFDASDVAKNPLVRGAIKGTGYALQAADFANKVYSGLKTPEAASKAWDRAKDAGGAVTSGVKKLKFW